MEKKNSIKLSYESDNKMGQVSKKGNKVAKAEEGRNEFFNTTQNSE